MLTEQAETYTHQLINGTGVLRVTTPEERGEVLNILHRIYCIEKNWVDSVEPLFDVSEIYNPQISWFIAYDAHQPVGIVRLYCGRTADQLDTAQFHFQETELDKDKLASFLNENLTAEIGRFAIAPEYRGRSRFAFMLMQAACTHALLSGCLHILTDVFLGDTHSPYDFHTRVLGFKPFASYSDKELNSHYPSILLLLDLKETYQRIKNHQPRLFRSFTKDWPSHLHLQLI